MEYMDSYKRKILLEKAISKFFKFFDEGKTDEEVLRIYAEQGIVVPEPFVKKARDKHKKFKHEKLDLEELEQETKEFKKVSLENEREIEIDGKQLASGIFNEEKKEKTKKNKIDIDTDEVEVLDDVGDIDSVTINVKEQKKTKKYPIPPEIRSALENDLRMKPLIRFVKSLKAVNSI